MSETLAPANPPAVSLAFNDPALAEHLETLSTQAIDALPFGVIGIDGDGRVALYNARESAYAGLSPASVIGRQMFEEVGPCMNTELVAGRFEKEAELDASLPFVLTLRMRPTPVTLRLIKRTGSPRRWLLLQRVQPTAGP